MAPTPANQAIAVPILCNGARRPAGFDAGAADERLSDSSSSVGISKIAILNCDPPSPDAGTVVLSVAEVAIERPSKWECVRHRPRYLCEGPNLRAIRTARFTLERISTTPQAAYRQLCIAGRPCRPKSRSWRVSFFQADVSRYPGYMRGERRVVCDLCHILRFGPSKGA